MENKIGRTVVFTKDLHCNFSSENVTKLTVYSLSRTDFTCEDWSSGTDKQCFKIADFMADIDSTGCEFSFASGINCGHIDAVDNICFCSPSMIKLPTGFNEIGQLYPKQKYPVPESMFEFVTFIDDFINIVFKEMQEFDLNYSIEKAMIREMFQQQQPACTNNDDDDLPF